MNNPLVYSWFELLVGVVVVTNSGITSNNLYVGLVIIYISLMYSLANTISHTLFINQKRQRIY